MRAYSPSYKVSPSGLGRLALTTLVGGAVIGAAVGLLSRWIYLVLVFPVLIGIGAGILIAAAVKDGKVRNPILAALCAVVMAVTLYGTLHYARYLFFLGNARTALASVLQQQYLSVNEIGMRKLLEEWLVKETGMRGFPGYLALTAKQGLRIGGFLSSGSYAVSSGESLFSGAWVWLYWLAELTGIAALAMWAAVPPAREPFCEHCQRWIRRGQHLGSVPLARGGEFLRLLSSGHVAEAHAMLSREDVPAPSLEVYLQHCDTCETGDPVLNVEFATFANGKLGARPLVHAFVTREEAQALAAS